MTWCNDCTDVQTIETSSPPPPPPPPHHHHPPPPPNLNTSTSIDHRDHHLAQNRHGFSTKNCPSCGHQIKCQNQARLHDLPGLPAGVKFDPTDQELLEHLEGKVKSDARMLHPLIDEFIPTIDGENGICYTHPEKLPGVSKDGLVRHFFHRPSKAYTTGTRKRRKVHSDTEGGETRWHKTGKTRAVQVGGKTKGYKKILVLYTNYGKQKKPEKTSWVMHQYHLGSSEDEKDGELVVSKVFYQTQPRQCSSLNTNNTPTTATSLTGSSIRAPSSQFMMMTHHQEYYGGSGPHTHPASSGFITFDEGASGDQIRSSAGGTASQHLMNPHFTVHDGSSNYGP